MPSYQIKEIAERSGFSTATLRYYEAIGLLPQAPRTTGGYRVYDDGALERLAFITRTRQLGCTLDEIGDLLTAWDGGRCGPVQDRLRAVVADKLAAAREQIVELSSLTSELRQAAAALERHRADGPCDDRCGCIPDNPSVGVSVSQPVSFTSKPGEVAIACTLDSGQLTGRTKDWDRLLTHVNHRQMIDGGLRATLDSQTPLDDLVRLTAAEHGCCQFFNFAITVDARGVALEITAPEIAQPMLAALFGAC